MQAAPIAAIRAVLTSGYLDKLVVAFTHLDQVVGDNLVTIEDREDHVIGSAENVVVALGRELATHDEQRLRTRIEGSSLLLGGIDKPLTGSDEMSTRTVIALQRLVAMVLASGASPASLVDARPTFDSRPFEEALAQAAADFQARWQGLLGREIVPGAPKQHWTRIKALTRRLADLGTEEYDNLKPVADLATDVREELYRAMRQPASWTPAEPTSDLRDELLDRFANLVSVHVNRIARQRIWPAHDADWAVAYRESGRGSTFVRAQILDSDIYAPAANRNPGGGSLTAEMIDALRQVADEMGITIR